ncbi:hypothetical protein BJV82DRAFT_656454 [Fennellomyces sp. T-0311]|nr:hypothetical protein BJV82DRAFT_656454 [Fennellomyces sp. T-0311]
MHILIQKAADLATSVQRSRLQSRIATCGNIREAQSLADDLVRRAPTSAKGYLLSGKLYQQQNKLRSASSVYSAGLRLVHPTNIEYALLKLEKERVMALIAKRHNEKPPLFPYEILNLIFHQLSLSDLLQCANVCESWYHAIVEWPDFWHKIVEKQELHIVRHNPRDLQSLLMVLLHSECHLVNALHFQDVALHSTIVPLLARVIRSISPPLTRLSFEDVDLLTYDLFGPILDASTHMTHFSYKRRNQPQQPSVMMKRRKLPTFRMMTVLKLSGVNNSALLTDVIQKCPNLEQLYLDSHDNIHHNQILHASRHVKFVCIARDAALPDGASHRGSGLVIDRAQALPSIMKKRPIELLYLDHRLITPRLRITLQHQVRELHLCSGSAMQQDWGIFESILCSLLGRCPALQVFAVHDPPTALKITNTVLRALAACTQLKYLSIDGADHEYTADGLDRFMGRVDLEYLKIPIDTTFNIHQIVARQPHLKTLYCTGVSIDFQTRFAIDPILQERGGSLVEDRYLW